ncbi:MAG: hypothetical protein E1N59_2829 [Puniceicoccaceae bacterium 5H]|nr:MAG: hypothetical protein E1N59_2829 [Puniceicoccaceae bacterium 5H]
MNTEQDIWNEGRKQLILFTDLGEQLQVIIKKIGMGVMPQFEIYQLGGLAEHEAAKLWTEKILQTDANGTTTETPVTKDFGFEEWFNALDAESQFQLVEEGTELQLPLFEKWSALQKKRLLKAQEQREATAEIQAQRRAAKIKATGIDETAMMVESMRDALREEAGKVSGQLLTNLFGDLMTKTAASKPTSEDTPEPAATES